MLLHPQQILNHVNSMKLESGKAQAARLSPVVNCM